MSSSNSLEFPEVWEGILVENLPAQMSHLVKILTSSNRVKFLATVQSAEVLKYHHINELGKIHFLLTDLDLDGPSGDKRMNGISLAEEIRHDPRYSTINFINQERLF